MILQAAVIAVLLVLSAAPVLSAGNPPRNALTMEGRVERGRGIFNGLGDCYHCHGYDAFLSRRPKHAPKLEQELAPLSPPDLRNQARLKARTPKEQLRAIRAHKGTRLLPKKTLTERELADLLAYLAAIPKQ